MLKKERQALKQSVFPVGLCCFLHFPTKT